jgi:hypothetical protein
MIRLRNLASETIALSLVVVGLSVAVIDAQHVRTMPYESGVPIASRLLESDEVVVVKKAESHATVLPEPSDVRGYVDYSVVASGSAVIARVVSVIGRLTDDQSWIETEVTFVTTEVLYSRIDRIAKRQRTTLRDEFGGQLRIGQCLVRAGFPLNVQADRDYLLFVSKDEFARLYVSRSVLAIEQGRLVDPSRSLKSTADREPLDGLQLSGVKSEIRRAAAKAK